MLRVEPQTGTYATARYGEVPLIDATATHDAETGEVTVFAINRSTEDTLALNAALGGFGDLEVVESFVLGGGDPYAVNTREEPEKVVPTSLDSARIVDGDLSAQLPPVSWCAIRLRATTSSS